MALPTHREGPPKADLARRGCATKEELYQQRRNLMGYCQVVHYLLAVFGTEEVNEEADEENTNFKQPEGMSVFCF